MTNRRRAREAAAQILYQLDADPSGSSLSTTSPAHVSDAIDAYFDHFDAPDKSKDFAASIVRGTAHQAAKIDEFLQQTNTRWRVQRMARVDRNVLRIAVYELNFVKELDRKIIINEAIELAKKFGNTDSSRFINGVLDGLGREE